MVAINPNEVQFVVDALRTAATNKQFKRTKRWKLAMLANAIDRRAG